MMGQVGEVRVVTADRSQISLRAYDLEGLLPEGHRARAIWAVVEGLDLSKFYGRIKARGSAPGRSATDPRVLVALWVYATSEGVGSARELERLCAEHRAYEWLRGGVAVNYHTLSDFRVEYGEELDELLTQVLAVMMKGKLIELKRVAQDGTKVIASANRGSFRRRKKLKDYLKQAREQVREVKRQAEDAEVSKRQKAARERAAVEREKRIEQALEELGKVEEIRAGQKKNGRKVTSEPQASTTDPESRHMRVAGGGYRPAYNVQFATDTQANAIVGVEVTNKTTDHGLVTPMIEQIEQRCGQRPQEYLVDGGYTGQKTIEAAAEMGVAIYGPPPGQAGKKPQEKKRGESEAIAQWRERMASEDAKPVYRQRASTIERVNADLRTHRTLNRIAVRGKNKVLCVALWNAVAYNILRLLSLTAST